MSKKQSPEERAATKRRYYESNRDQILERRKPATRRRLYGLSEGDFRRLMDAQGGSCAVCRAPFSGVSPNVDHDHRTGLVRGLLCHNCNLVLGHAKDSAVTLRLAAEYLDKSER